RACRSHIPRGRNGSHAHGYEFSRKHRECLVVPVGPSLLDADIPALDEAALRQTLPKRVGIEAIGIGRGAVQEAHERRALLRTSCNCPCTRCATTQRDELATSHPALRLKNTALPGAENSTGSTRHLE